MVVTIEHLGDLDFVREGPGTLCISLDRVAAPSMAPPRRSRACKRVLMAEGQEGLERSTVEVDLHGVPASGWYNATVELTLPLAGGAAGGLFRSKLAYIKTYEGGRDPDSFCCRLRDLPGFSRAPIVRGTEIPAFVERVGCVHIPRDQASFWRRGPAKVGLNMDVGGSSGWTVAALNILEHLAADERFFPVPLRSLSPRLPAETIERLTPYFDYSVPMRRNLARNDAVRRRNGGTATYRTEEELLAAAPFHVLNGAFRPLDYLEGESLAACAADGACAAELGRAGAMNLVYTPMLMVHPLTRVSYLPIDTALLGFSEETTEVWGAVNVGIIFFEYANVTAADVARVNAFDRVLCGSTWNRDLLLRAGAPARKLGLFLQGVDARLFDASRRDARALAAAGAAGEVRIFSGGKLEFRKGQDIVLAAFKRYLERNPESRAVLVVAWVNNWRALMKSIEWSPHTEGVPAEGAEGLLRWAEAFGVPRGRVRILDLARHEDMPAVLAGMHGAIFLNRCEGGTNLVAMEALAMGVPSILSNNTGHADVIRSVGEGGCYVARRQGRVTVPDLPRDDPAARDPMDWNRGWGEGDQAAFEGWGESDVDEAADLLRRLEYDREDAERRGRRAAAVMARDWSWRPAMEALTDAIAGSMRDYDEEGVASSRLPVP